MEKKKSYFSLMLILIATMIIYIPSIHGDYIFDDFNNIVYNYRVLIKDLSPISLMQALTCTKGGVRPLAHLTNALNYYFFGINPFYFHLINLLIHLINTILVFILVKKLWIKFVGKEKKEIAAIITSVFFATATIQTSAVSYIIQRMALGMTMFSLISILLFLNKRYFYSLIAFLFALGFKENAVVLIPIFMYLYWIENGKDKKQFFYGIVILLVISFLILSPYGFDLWTKFEARYRVKGVTVWQRILTEPRVIFHYLSLILFPLYSRFVLNYNYSISTSLVNPITTLLSILGIIGIIVFAFICKKKYISFWTGFFLISLSIENTIVPLDIAYEHRMYFPMIALSAIAGYLGAKSFEKKYVLAIISLFIIFNAINTFERNSQYKDYTTILKQDLKHYPKNPVALYNMFSMLVKSGKKDLAIKYLKKCVNLQPKQYNVYASYSDYLAGKETIDSAVNYLKEILKTNKYIDKPHLIMWKIAQLFEKKQDMKNAQKWYSNAMKKHPDSIKIRRDYGLFLFNKGNYYYGYLNMAKAYELDNYQPLTVYYLAKMTKQLKMKDKFKFFSGFYKLLYQKGKYYNLPKPVF